MKKLDILGLELEEGIQIIKNNFSDSIIEIQETLSWNKQKQTSLTESRILKVLKHKDKFTIIISYF